MIDNRSPASWRAIVPVIASLASVVFAAACHRGDRPPKPSFQALFPIDSGELMTTSSPAFVDLDGDGSRDIVFGTGVDRTRPAGRHMQFTGEPAVSGEVVAVSGATNRVLWKVPNPRDAFTTPRFALLNKDKVPDVVMGGREGVLTAYDGRNGNVLWRVLGEDVVKTPFPYYFLTPAVIDDVNGDGIADLIDTYGGNDTRMPTEPRGPGSLMVISGADGKVIATREMADSTESYSSPVVYRRRDGAPWVVFGTGGESLGGAEYRAPVSSLVDGTFAKRVEKLVPFGRKGVIAPPTMLDLNGDGELDIVVSTFDGRLIALDGASSRPLWSHEDAKEETYHGPAVVRMESGRLGLFLSRGIGAFPRYIGTVHRLYDATDGRVLYEYRDPNYPAGAPIAVDLTGDGIDEPMFFTTRFPAAQGARIHVLHVPTRSLVTHDVTTNLWSTPAVADLRTTGKVELVALSWLTRNEDGSMAHPALSWQLLRLDLSAKTPASASWAGYMGSATDGQYHPPAR